MITHRDEQIEPEAASIALLHLHLHGSAPLEDAARADDQGEVVGSQFAVALGGVGVGIAGRLQDGVAADPALQALLSQCQPLQLAQAVPIGCAVYQCVFQ